ncbi:MAG: HDIG domain-containing protein [Bacteroidales bacterium]|nr:HDIG domain-containing protein [Bacteroidales bacterium]
MRKFISYIISHLRIFYLISVMAATVALILIMFPNDYSRVQYDYAVGSFWRGDDLYAPYDFTILQSESENKQEVERIKNESTRYFYIDSSARQTARQRASERHFTPRQNALVQQIISLVYNSNGYCTTDEELSGHPVVILSGNVGYETNPDLLTTPADVERFVSQAIADSNEAARLTRILTDSVLAPSIVYDANRTHLELDTRLSQLSYSSRMIQQDELIVSKGQRVDEETALVLASLEQEESHRKIADFNIFLHYVGQALLCIIAFVALYIFLKNIRHPMLEDIKKVTFAFFIVIFISAIVALLVRINPDYVLLAPVCIVPILMRIFFDMRVALYIHIVAVIIIGNMVPNSYEFIFYQLVSGMMSIITVRNFEKRSSFFAVALVIFSTYSLIYIAGVLSTETSFANLHIDRFLIFFLNAILTLLAYPLIFLFERMFGMTTNLTLMEISSTNTPALRELSQKAPGTFQHSMQVANISEDLINEIGGNALLAKVGALYHDIGKVMAPIYFTENQNNGFNPHDNIDYEESAHIITQHVRDGIQLAKKYRLPAEVTDFIRTHHGTTVTGYFYAQAKLHHPEEDINISDYRYLGPTPFSRETAVVMLVDSVEAACKSLKNHDKESIYRMVDNIINDKIEHNQLNNCPLTLQDITLIRSHLKDRMMSIYHVRISYPMKAN